MTSAGTNTHGLYMVMEFLQGEDLRGAIRHGNTGDLRKKLKIAIQIARALEYVHRAKIIHRDIKPENVHINTAGVVKLMDFGIAKTEDLSVTRAGYVLGTPYYMAPEQVKGEKITELVDVYAFGILLFELLARAEADRRRDRGADLLQHSPRTARPVARCIAAAIAAVRDQPGGRCTAKAPADRPQDFGAVAAALEAARDDLDAPTRAMPQATRAAARCAGCRTAPAWLIPGIAVLGCCVLAGSVLRHARTSRVPQARRHAQDDLHFHGPDGAGGGRGICNSAGTSSAWSLPAFYVDQTEVPNSEYAKFCQATGHALPGAVSRRTNRSYPVVNVTIDDAQARSPPGRASACRTPFEWEKAARGTDGRTFPWGNEHDPSQGECGHAAIAAGGRFRERRQPQSARCRWWAMCGSLSISCVRRARMRSRDFRL